VQDNASGRIDKAVFHCLDQCENSEAPLSILARTLVQLDETGRWNEADLRELRDRVARALSGAPRSYRPPKSDDFSP
jgi:hypothetical protein